MPFIMLASFVMPPLHFALPRLRVQSVVAALRASNADLLAKVIDCSARLDEKDAALLALRAELAASQVTAASDMKSAAQRLTGTTRAIAAEAEARLKQKDGLLRRACEARKQAEDDVAASALTQMAVMAKMVALSEHAKQMEAGATAATAKHAASTAALQSELRAAKSAAFALSQKHKALCAAIQFHCVP